MWAITIHLQEKGAPEKYRKITHIHTYIYIYYTYLFNLYFEVCFTDSSGDWTFSPLLPPIPNGQWPTSPGLGKIGDAEEQVAGLQQMLVEKKSGSLFDVKVMWVFFNDLVVCPITNDKLLHYTYITCHYCTFYTWGIAVIFYSSRCQLEKILGPAKLPLSRPVLEKTQKEVSEMMVRFPKD